MSAETSKVRIGVLGASGYTGADLIRLLAGHPRSEIALMTANAQAGKPLSAVFPHLGGLELPELIRVEEADWGAVDVAFCCLPHGTTQEIVAALPEHLKVIDLSADFRLRDPAVYAEWYGHEHRAPKLQEAAVYGLPGFNRAPGRLSGLLSDGRPAAAAAAGGRGADRGGGHHHRRQVGRQRRRPVAEGEHADLRGGRGHPPL